MSEQALPDSVEQTLINQIDRALQSGANTAILSFSAYRIGPKEGTGAQGVVYRVTSPLGKLFALKVYHPADGNIEADLEYLKSEMASLADLSHSNIPRIYSAGSAEWDLGEGRWKISEATSTELPAVPRNRNSLYFYIMQHVAFAALGHVLGLSSPEETYVPPTRHEERIAQVDRFELMCIDMCNAVIALHASYIYHGDISLQNMRYCHVDRGFKLVDFGFSQLHEAGSGQSAKADWKYKAQADVRQLAVQLRDTFAYIHAGYDNNRASAISEILERAANQQPNDDITDAATLKASLEPYFLRAHQATNLVLAIGSYLTPSLFGQFTMKIRIPVWGSILVPREVGQLIDTEPFQRLRGVRQLGPTMLVYPGATHTRFEHSLGVYWMSLRYLANLTRNPQFRRTCNSIDRTIKVTVLSALLHDIGHYPYSHWVEEIDDFPKSIARHIPKHEPRARDIITSGQMADLIKREWGVEPEDVASVIDGTFDNNDPDLCIANSIIDAPLDADKLDYLTRDSVHCGVGYGHGIDHERLFDSVHFDADEKKVVVNDKGRSLLMAVLTCRNIMYQEVYWHKTVRACDSMFKRFFYQYTRLPSVRESVVSWLKLPDDQFLMNLAASLDKRLGRSKGNREKLNALKKLIDPLMGKRTGLYKVAYTYSRNYSHRRGYDRSAARFFDLVLKSRRYTDLKNISDRFATAVRRYADAVGFEELAAIADHDIIVDMAPVKEKSELFTIEHLHFYNQHMHAYEPYPDQIVQLDEYLKKTQQAYIFCSPRYAPHFKRLSSANWNTIFALYHNPIEDTDITESQGDPNAPI